MYLEQREFLTKILILKTGCCTDLETCRCRYKNNMDVIIKIISPNFVKCIRLSQNREQRREIVQTVLYKREKFLASLATVICSMNVHQAIVSLFFFSERHSRIASCSNHAQNTFCNRTSTQQALIRDFCQAPLRSCPTRLHSYTSCDR